jgi:hypothetical protein
VLAVFEEERFLLGENRPNSDPEDILGNFVSDNYFTMLCTKSLEFHPRQWVVIFKMLSTRTLHSGLESHQRELVDYSSPLSERI